MKDPTKLGWSHAKRRAELLRVHLDGTPCPCQPGCGPACLCKGTSGLPMYRDPQSNPDGLPLDADHSVGRGVGLHADRLMLATCNRSRGGKVGRSRQLAFTETLTSRHW